MKLVGELKEKVENAKTPEEAKNIIKEAGMELTAEELKEAAGGWLRGVLLPKSFSQGE